MLPPTVTTICFADAAENAESCSWVRVSSVVGHGTSAGKTYGEHGGEHRAHTEQPAVERERGRGRRRGREGRGGRGDSGAEGEGEEAKAVEPRRARVAVFYSCAALFALASFLIANNFCASPLVG